MSDEQDEARRRDVFLMNEALGIGPKIQTAPSQELEQSEMKTLLERGTLEREMEDIERVEGLGAAPYV